MRRNTAIVVAVSVLALVVLFAVPVLAFLLGFGTMGMPMGGWTWGTVMHDGWFGGNAPIWFALLGVLSQLAFFAVLAGGVYLLYRAVTRDRTDPALEELRAAYARGDVDDDEYERRRNRLEEDR
ncbi:SHOCT domain-containing protein [Halorubellus sp. JP-L1]|uniref:SHOCT domain-containing protein n=1 Tax=Halorubellus sp. JP-L1 TaxID=2715753 RepID=UPI0014084878|nr:SHOCT domain-containing protein [Halorubellus sp. JP-L1]NHN40032.1 SHOCT domain-containing protein [Halorubellus sp. JP-L1]